MTIKLKIKNKYVELSPAEAEDLFNQLSQIFDKTPPIYPVNPIYPQNPQWPTTTPTFPQPWVTWCASDSNITSSEDLAWHIAGK